jgi:poly(3-hydroxybutyrate) depolymerase
MCTAPKTFNFNEDKTMFDRAMQLSRRTEDTEELTGFCGKRVTRDYFVKDCNQEQEKQCNRKYELFIPKAACQQDIGILPLVFAVHCQDCHVNDMVHWQTVAQIYSFVLVIPYGVDNTFNGQQCCGNAMELQVDDVGFFKGIINEVSTDFGTVVSKDLVYGYGHKNGGYMVVTAAPLFRAISPVAGYHVDLPRLHRPVGLFLHHSLNDNDAKFTGCCTDPKLPKCDVPSTAEHCTNVMDFVQNFGSKVNHCKGEMQEIRNENGLKCYEAGHCKANTTICLHPKEGDFNPVGHNFPMTMEVADFFARDSCEIKHGTWDYRHSKCVCKHANNTAAYCLSKGSLGWGLSFDGLDDVPLFLTLPLVAAAIGILILGIVRWRRTSKEEEKYKEFFQLSTVELSEISEEEVKPLSGFI